MACLGYPCCPIEPFVGLAGGGCPFNYDLMFQDNGIIECCPAGWTIATDGACVGLCIPPAEQGVLRENECNCNDIDKRCDIKNDEGECVAPEEA